MTNLSLIQFKQQVLEDFRVACLGQEALREALVEGCCKGTTEQADVAQVALSRFVSLEDRYLSCGLDLTYELVTKRRTTDSFFKSLFAGGLDELGSRGSLMMATGMALSDASTEEGRQKKRVTVYTIDGQGLNEGEFFSSLSFATARSLPLAIVVWNCNGVAENGNWVKQLSGFGSVTKQGRNLSVETVRGDDYAALCRVLSSQVQKSRGRVVSVTFVGSSEKGTEAFAGWLCEKQIATREQVGEIVQDIKQRVEKERKGAYLASLVSDVGSRRDRATMGDIVGCLRHSSRPVMSLPRMEGIVSQAVGVARTGLLPIIEIEESDLQKTILDNNPDVSLLMRTVVASVGSLLNNSPETVLVLTPANSYEAEKLYEQTVKSDCQAIVIEPLKSDIKTGEPAIGGVSKLTDGEDVTVLTYGSGTTPALDAVRMLDAHNTRVELLHLPSLRPLDTQNVIATSLRKTKRLLIVDTDPTQKASDYILGQLAKRFTPLRYLVREPMVVSKKSGEIDGRDVCKGIQMAVS